MQKQSLQHAPSRYLYRMPILFSLHASADINWLQVFVNLGLRTELNLNANVSNSLLKSATDYGVSKNSSVTGVGLQSPWFSNSFYYVFAIFAPLHRAYVVWLVVENEPRRCTAVLFSLRSVLAKALSQSLVAWHVRRRVAWSWRNETFRLQPPVIVICTAVCNHGRRKGRAGGPSPPPLWVWSLTFFYCIFSKSRTFS